MSFCDAHQDVSVYESYRYLKKTLQARERLKVPIMLHSQGTVETAKQIDVVFGTGGYPHPR